jgi:hypothetical protein
MLIKFATTTISPTEAMIQNLTLFRLISFRRRSSL